MALPAAINRALEVTVDPRRGRAALERLFAERPGDTDRLAADPALLEAVTALVEVSDSLTRVLLTDPQMLEVLASLDRRPDAPRLEPGDAAEELVRWKHRELARIAVRDQTGTDDLPATMVLLSRLGDDVLHAALTAAGIADRLSVIGMGKLAAHELNYASDVDVMFACADDDDPAELATAARQVLALAGQCFRIDANLRPEGRNGPLVRTVTGFETYWDQWAEPWEFQALIKSRSVAGPRDVSARHSEARRRHLWQRTFSADDLRSLREMKRRAEAAASTRRHGDREIKRSPGGIRDVEFSVQLLQLVHGRHDPSLREPNTLVALDELADAGYAAPTDVELLVGAYEFLRDLEHRLQLVEEQAVHVLPELGPAHHRLAHAMGFRGSPARSAGEQLEEALALCRTGVRAIHERLYFRPLLEAFAGGPGTMSVEAAEARLSAFGFRDATRTRQAVRELTRGLTRSSRLMQQLLPLILEWLSRTPDPDLGLLALRRLVGGTGTGTSLTQTFRDSPEAARRLCLLAGTSRLIGDLLHHNPDLAAAVGDDRRLEARSRDHLVERAATALAWREDHERQAGLKRFTDREGLRVMAADVLGLCDTTEVGRMLTRLAESALEAAFDLLAPSFPFAVIALGRFAGQELSYASDLDVLFVHGAEADTGDALAAATEMLRLLGGATPARQVYEIDADLRPEGRNGPLSRTVASYVAYHERWAEPWERQAMVRARVVAGDQALGAELIEALRPFVWGAPLTNEQVRHLRRIKARVEKERIPPGEDPQFHLKLGRGTLSDVEWTAQLLQLRHRVEGASTLHALKELVDAGALPAGDASLLEESYRFCERTRNRWHLIQGRAGDALPTQPDELARLARSLDTHPAGLREQYRRVTRRARRVMEHHFYGREL